MEHMEHIVLADLTNSMHTAAVVYLLNEYAKDNMGGGSALSDFTKRNLIPELKKRQGIYTIIALIDDIPVGLAICIEGFSTFACKPLLNIHDMVVVAEYRGRGFSKKLLSKAEEIARELNCCKLTLEVLEGNTLAKKVYSTCGFEGYELNPKIGKALFWQKSLV